MTLAAGRMSERPSYRGDHYWRNGDKDWWDPGQLPVKDRPTVGYIPKNFEGPSFVRDGIDMSKFVEGIVAHVASNPNRRPNTPPGGRSQKTPRLSNYEVVLEASPNGANDMLTNNRRDPTHKCHMTPYGTSTTAGYVIDSLRGQEPGTWSPCGRNNNFFASVSMHAEETANKRLYFIVASMHNLNFAEGILDLVEHNIGASSPKDWVKFTDYYPPLERTSNENRGYVCLAVCLTSATDFRIFRGDGKTEIKPGEPKPKDNGILFVTQLDPLMASIRSAQVIRFWEWVGCWPRRDSKFNPLIQNLINVLSRRSKGWFKRGVGVTPAFYKACMSNKNPTPYIHPITGLVGIAKNNVSVTPVRGRIPPNTRSVRPGLLEAYYYPTRPDRITRAEARAEKNRLAKRRAIKEAQSLPSPCASDVSDDDGGGAPTQTATPQAVANPNDGENEEDERDEVDAVASNSVREEEKEGNAPFSPSGARTQPAALSDQEDEVEKSPPARRISKIPIRRKKPTPPVESENFEEEFDEEVEPVRKPSTRSATQKKGAKTVAASNEEPAAGRRLRTRADTKAANTATNDAANADAAPKRDHRLLQLYFIESYTLLILARGKVISSCLQVDMFGGTTMKLHKLPAVVTLFCAPSSELHG
ncbi:hypothetical protein CYLTODRAFT_413165 [Cylindrobasidium torrendii FP15055 ss-10]|uniref:Uncharacterized protein n=1 Tax=Cylindrobasidium torrendii FP15055 ss-10 TaxID=1314674 RepID=A0A0D7B594_9AGAR|nr:hypothetical protein CYLTODRAFT_413165 [Cylindrobasidium torrendii FP15055 ss-10]